MLKQKLAKDMFGNMLNLLLITITIVFCIDLSGGMDSLSHFVWKKLYPTVKYSGWRIPLIGCSLCSSWWSGILYLLITGSFSWFLLAYVALLSYLTPVIGSTLILLKDSLIWLVNKMYELID